MKKYTIELTAEQVIALFEMCEHCASFIHKAVDGEEVPQAKLEFAKVMEIQNKLDGCDNLDRLDNLDEPNMSPLAPACLEFGSTSQILTYLLR